MDTVISEEAILQDLVNSFQQCFGMKVLDAVPIRRGWLNLKWKLTTDAGAYLLKQYNRTRYRLYKPEELHLAFSAQTRLHRDGLPVPRPLTCQHRVLLESDGGERFMAMEYCQGLTIQPGRANLRQMYDLGRSTGRMHRLLNDGTLGGKGSPQFVPPSREDRLEHWKSMLRQAEECGKAPLLDDIELQLKATEEINEELFEIIETGWAHRDLWSDNLLFHEDRLSAILDFDRLNYDYPLLDAARAVMSCAFDDRLDVSLVSAFSEGYREEQTVDQGYLANSLQLLWYMESAWWIHADMDKHSAPPARFAKEMNWLANNYRSLRDLLGHL
ncbi:phosphotransferase [Paenibacillus soyae]|uniref:Phosphotransferase n=1 Tax=Paenibacillus soyae TaxID=2969249 RepID=A0A9X2MSW7_9BACL|nr:phosphotransferase [Paenibacillus soyae]MCR2805248.1 phosphotransferase [Paenibacillus soyae]